jgi:hypothetical protein
LNHDDLVPDRKIPRDHINLCDEFIDQLFDTQTLNIKSDPIDTFSIKCKEFVGWHVLEVGDHFFWVLIIHFSSPYTLVGWHVGSPSTHKFFKVIRSSCKAGDTFLYVKFHLT